MAATNDPPGAPKRVRVTETDLDRLADDVCAAAKRLDDSTPPPVRQKRRTSALTELAAWAKELAPSPPNPRTA